MMKTCDHVERGYLEWILAKMACPQPLIRRIMLCVTSVSFRILINGNSSKDFTSTRGIN